MKLFVIVANRALELFLENVYLHALSLIISNQGNVKVAQPIVRHAIRLYALIVLQVDGFHISVILNAQHLISLMEKIVLLVQMVALNVSITRNALNVLMALDDIIIVAINHAQIKHF